MKRQILAAGISTSLGALGLVMLPPAEATAPCGLYQNPNATNSTGDNQAVTGVNVNNVGNVQGNVTSAGSNLLCDAEVGSNNAVYVGGSGGVIGGGQPATGDRCETTQNNSGPNETGRNHAFTGLNVNNLGNIQGNETAILDDVACDAEILSGNTLVIFPNGGGYGVNSGNGGGRPPEKCIEKQGSFRRNTTGSNSVFALLANINNVLNVQGNMTSIGGNTLCNASVLSGNLVVIDPVGVFHSILGYH